MFIIMLTVEFLCIAFSLLYNFLYLNLKKIKPIIIPLKN